MKKKSLSSRLVGSPYYVWAAIFIVVPVIMVLYYSLTDRNGSFTLSNIADLRLYADTLVLSVWLGAIATAVCFVISYPIAYILSRAKASTQRTLMLLVMLPMWINLLLRTYSWMTILEDTGIINSLLAKIGIGPVHMINTSGAVVLGMVYNFMPYMIMPLYSVMTKIGRNTIEAAQDLGASSLQVLCRVVFPMSVPGIASGITMVFVPCVSTFYISQKLGGTGYTLIGDVIDTQFTNNARNMGATLSLILMVMIIICMLVMNQFTSDDDEGAMLV
ncbi:MAG: ABC transporter permease [Clostridia bacterium]|nr:ABC transporter permease [Clostridia bacterium]